MIQQPPKSSPRQQQQTPQQRLLKLQEQYSYQEVLVQLSNHESFPVLINAIRGEAKRRKNGINAIHWDSKPEAFEAFEKRSLYGAGYIQGVEWAANLLETLPQQQANLKAEIEKLAKEIKSQGKRTRR